MFRVLKIKVAPPQKIELTPGMAVLTCTTCGFDWETPRTRGSYSSTCPECTPDNVINIRSRRRVGDKVPDDFRRLADGKSTKAYLHLLRHVDLRMANEEALACIRLGKYHEAIAALESVPARRRTM